MEKINDGGIFMKKLIHALFPAIFAFCATGLFADETEAVKKALSLSDYISLVEKNNKDLKIASQNSIQAKMQMRQAMSALLPTAGLQLGYTRNLTDVEKPTTIGSYAPEALGGAGKYMTYDGVPFLPAYNIDLDSNYDNEILAALAVNMDLYNPSSVGRYSLARKNYRLNQNVELLTEQKLVLGAKKLYAQVQLLDALLSVQKEAAETAQAVYENQQKKFQAGTITELDMRMAEVDWKNRLTDVADAEKNLKLGKIALKTLAAIPLSNELEIEGSSDSAENILQSKLQGADDDFSTVLSRSTEYQITLLAKEMSDSQFVTSITSYLPTVSANFTLAYGQMGGMDEFLGKTHDDWNDYHYTAASVGVKITLPLLTGGYRPAVNKEQAAGKEKARLQVSQKRDELERSYEDAKLRLEEASRKIESAISLEEVANRAVVLASTSLKNGLGTQVAVSQAETQLAQAKLNMQNAIFEYRSAIYDLEFLVGETRQ